MISYLIKVTKMELYQNELGKKLLGPGHRCPESLLGLVWLCVPLALRSVLGGFKTRLPARQAGPWI